MNTKEVSSTFYDVEYCLTQEYRYISGAFNSKAKGIMDTLGDINGKKVLDVGCGAGFLTNEIYKKGGDVLGVDYSQAQVDFARSRFPEINFKVASAYELPEGQFDIITMLSVIEHLDNFNKVVDEVKKRLKPGGLFVISTDLGVRAWFNKFNRFSKDGRAYRFIKEVESFRKKFKNYHDSHINEQDFGSIKNSLTGFEVIKHTVFPMVAVPLRDLFLKFLPMRFRGDYQCVVAKLAE